MRDLLLRHTHQILILAAESYCGRITSEEVDKVDFGNKEFESLKFVIDLFFQIWKSYNH